MTSEARHLLSFCGGEVPSTADPSRAEARLKPARDDNNKKLNGAPKGVPLQDLKAQLKSSGPLAPTSGVVFPTTGAAITAALSRPVFPAEAQDLRPGERRCGHAVLQQFRSEEHTSELQSL